MEYEMAISNLEKVLPFIKAVAIIETKEDVVYISKDWNIKSDLHNLNSTWASLRTGNIIISGVKYITRACTNDRFIATSLKKDGHLIAVKDDERMMLALIEPDGIIPFTTMEMARTLASLKSKVPYLDEKTELGAKAKEMEDTAPPGAKKKQETIKNEPIDKDSTDIPFTARLMAYYRYKEQNSDDPLIIDPFAKLLVGDIEEFFKKHIRYSEMDYPLVRSYYIDTELLTEWCNTQKESQIVLLGAGLDTRAYRFAPLKINKHIVFELDFPVIINYKKRILEKKKPFCRIKRIGIDLSDSSWSLELIKNGFSSNISTFWIIEGLAYYIDKEKVAYLLKTASEISADGSQLFIDIMQRSRWFESSEPLINSSTDPFSRHFQWGMDIKQVASFFKSTGWDILCSFADDHDQGRDVGQKAMIFVEGVKL